MIDSKIHIAIKSYKRAGLVKTINLFPFAYIWVPESQKSDYEKYYHGRIISIPDEKDGNLCRKSNAILDNSPCEWTLILDDDISKIGMWEDGAHIKLSCDTLKQIIIRYFCLADDFGVKLWGISQKEDALIYDIFKPFHLLAPILGPFNGHLNPELRYDESVLGKDDYDFWLQNIRKYHKTLRVNKFHYTHDHGKMAGGFVSIRSMEIEKQGVNRMIEKWGTKIFKQGGTAGGACATGKNILNSRISIPINGC